MTAPRLGSAILAVTTLFAMTAAATTALAQFDHLKCYKAKDQKTFKRAQADLTALQTQFGVAESCSIKPKAKLFCVPVSKTVTAIEQGQDTPFPAEDLGFDRLCYKVKCPKVTISPEQVSDQFGTRTIEGFKAAMICTPAVKGPAPTTSTTISTCIDLDSDSYGPGCPNGPDCDDTDFTVNPGALEVCDNIDNDCNGIVDDNPSDCGGGSSCCSGLCIDTTSDVSNCGGCNSVCTPEPNSMPQCTGGACTFVCDAGFADCQPGNGCETNTQSDSQNCGACNTVCSMPMSCVSGTCQ